MSEPEAVNLEQKLNQFSELWSPKIVSSFNGHDVMVVKCDGTFPMHNHPDSDDFILVIDGRITIETEKGDVALDPGELYVVPKGVMHRPIAHGEAKILLIEPKGEPNTGDHAAAARKVEI